MATALEVEHLAVRFGEKSVLRDLSFRLPAGSCLAIIGPNGAGKSLLLQALVGYIPHEGSLRWAPGTRIGYVPQRLDLRRDLPLDGYDFLRARAAVAHTSPDEIDQTLGQVGLSHDECRQPIGQLSGGQFQRLLLAFALIGSPSVLLLDEPAAGLDEPGQAKLYDIIDRIRSERSVTVLFISHDLSVIFQHATHVLCLSRARAWFGPPREVVTPEILCELYGAPVRFHVHDLR